MVRALGGRGGGSGEFSALERDAAGLIIFDEDVANYVAPSTRQGQLFRLLHAIEKAMPGTRPDFTKPFVHFQNFLHRRHDPPAGSAT